MARPNNSNNNRTVQTRATTVKKLRRSKISHERNTDATKCQLRIKNHRKLNSGRAKKHQRTQKQQKTKWKRQPRQGHLIPRQYPKSRRSLKSRGRHKPRNRRTRKIAGGKNPLATAASTGTLGSSATSRRAPITSPV